MEPDEDDDAVRGSIYDEIDEWQPEGMPGKQSYRNDKRFAGAGRAGSDVALWMDAEARVARALADAAAAASRLMGLLRDAADAACLRRRIAAEEAAAALRWSGGDGPHAELMVAVGGKDWDGELAAEPGRHAQICAANARLLVEAGNLFRPETLETLVASAKPRHGYSGPELEVDRGMLMADLIGVPGEWEEALSQWLDAAVARSEQVHWLTSSCAIFMTWPAGYRDEEASALEALAIASRAAQPFCRELGFLPVSKAAQRRRPMTRWMRPDEALLRWLEWVKASSQEYELEICRWRDWRQRVSETFMARHGKRKPRTALGAAEIAIRQGYFTSGMIVEELKCSASAVRTVTGEMARLGLIKDEGRSRRLHLWRPNL